MLVILGFDIISLPSFFTVIDEEGPFYSFLLDLCSLPIGNANCNSSFLFEGICFDLRGMMIGRVAQPGKLNF